MDINQQKQTDLKRNGKKLIEMNRKGQKTNRNSQKRNENNKQQKNT